MTSPQFPLPYPFLVVLLMAIFVASTVDIVMDAPTSLLSVHILVELAIVGLSLGTAIYLLRQWQAARSMLLVTTRELGERQRERDAWRQRTRELLAGLGEEIDRQLGKWGVTPTERQTALLLLKGLSLRQIAELSEKSERTVRQHAISVYRKSGLGGRAELSAFFLEDLLLPIEQSHPELVADSTADSESGAALN